MSVEVMLVDNNSTDNTQATAKAVAAKASIPVHVLSEPRPGVCRAKNTGARHATGKVLVFTDDDCVMSPDYLTDLHKHYAADADPVVRGGRVELGDKADLPITIKTDDTLARLSDWSHPGGFIHGCNLTMASAVFEKIGGFDEEFGPGAVFVAAEDTELLFRAREHGIPVEYVPDMAVHHFHGRRDYGQIAKLWRQYQIGNGALIAKYRGRRTLAKHLYWDARKAAMEVFGGQPFDAELKLSHSTLVAGQIKGMLLYLQHKALSKRRA